ncbi:MAG: hypothetical protein ACQEQ0_09385 [Bacteroidota bacterium]
MKRINGRIRKLRKDRVLLTVIVGGFLYFGIVGSEQQREEASTSVRKFIEDGPENPPEVVDSNKKTSGWVSGAVIGLPM